MIIKLPYQFEPRDYQARILKAFFVDKKKHFCLVWHRRAGKTKMCVNIIIASAHQRVGAYYMLYPQLKQARRNVWEARGDDGIAFIDHFPKELIHRINNNEMKIHFKNGSVFELVGTDKTHFEKVRGSNPLGIIYDEYAQQNPNVRDIMMPIIAQNGGWEIIISTPHGHNHFHYLYKALENSDDFVTEILTIDDTKKQDGTPVVPKEVVENLITQGDWSEDKVKQEFYCDFNASIKGAIFGNQMKWMRSEKRIHNFPIDPSCPVSTYWDLGIGDATSIWFEQSFPDGTIKLINYYENSGQPISHYINYCDQFRAKEQIVYKKHHWPHDGANRNLATGKSLVHTGRQLGLDITILERPKSKSLGIEVGRTTFKKLIMHETNCRRGIDCLLSYKFNYNEAMQTFSNEPKHDWASHGADSYMIMCLHKRKGSGSPYGRTIRNAVRLGD